MDTEFARTFLAVIEAGSFVGAAERVHVSQSTISARIAALEQQLGVALFVRNKAGAALTPAGQRFQRHASALVRTIEHARHDIGMPRDVACTLVVGGRIGLWEGFLLSWLAEMRQRHPRIAIRAESGLEPELMHGLVEGRMDIGVMYTPQSRPGLVVQHLFDDHLVMVSTRPAAKPRPQADYVYVDWGPEFYARHAALFPQFGGPLIAANIGWLGLQHIAANGGTSYFPRRIAAPLLASGRLHEVGRAPTFTLPAYVVFAAEHDPRSHGPGIALLDEHARRLAASAQNPVG